MSKQLEQIAITIDNRHVQVDKGMTILQAAEGCGVYIPTLCAHKELTPFGGCRMCIVEVEGMRGFPTSCTTPVTEGMIVRTQTTQVNAVRTEILQLILSEHPVSCLLCEESEDCKRYNVTARKVGVTTGCRYCPNDGQCELHEVAEKMGIKEIGYPILYRNLPVEKEDPFYDRDYNLCILCGRCIRMCQEIRTAGTLAFKQRGNRTIIGPAYNRTHFEAGCEFCGACVSVCPTGALSEKTRKWEGKADREETTTCAFCGIGCQVRLQIKGNEIIGSLPADDPLINNGQLCVKGRFCVTETVNDHRRLKKPYKNVSGTKVIIPMEEAVEIAAPKIAECGPDDFAMLVSPNCTTEDLYIAQKFVRAAVGSNNIDTSSKIFYGPAFNAYLSLMQKAAQLSTLKKSSVILCVGLDTRFAQSVAGVELRLATRRGAKLISINPNPHNLTLIADKWLQPPKEEMLNILNALGELTGRSKSSKAKPGEKDSIYGLSDIAAMLKGAENPAILVGTTLLIYPDSALLFEAIEKIANNINADILPLPPQNNLMGSLIAGAYPELLPGAIPLCKNNSWNANSIYSGDKKKVLYIMGEVPQNIRPTCDFLIYQNIFHAPQAFEADLAFPGAAFSETDGTFINGEMRIQRVRKGVEPPVDARADWMILCQIAKKMGKAGFDFKDINEIHAEMAGIIPAFAKSEIEKRQPIVFPREIRLSIQPVKANNKRISGEYPFKLNIGTIEHSYRGYPLTNWVEGLNFLLKKNLLYMNSLDAAQIGLSPGDKAAIRSSDREWIWPVEILDDHNPGTVSIALPMSEAAGFSSHCVSIRKSDV